MGKVHEILDGNMVVMSEENAAEDFVVMWVCESIPTINAESNRSVKMLNHCSYDPNHLWESTVDNRTKQKSGCPEWWKNRRSELSKSQQQGR